MVSHSYNTNREGSKYFVHSKWKNYLAANGSWETIDCEVVDTGSDFVMDKAPFSCTFPHLSTGTAIMTSNCRYDIWKKEEITADPLDMMLEANDAVEVQGQLFDINGNGKYDAVIYPQAFPQWDADLIYYVEHGKAPRLKKIIQYNSNPGAHEAKFHQDYSYNVEVSSQKIPIGLTRRQHRDECHARLNTPQPVGSDKGFYVRKDAEAQKRGIGIKECKIWDSAGKVEGLQSDIRKHGQGFTLTKYIPADFFTDAVYPVRTDAEYTIYPDAHVETTSVDGYTYRFIGSGETVNVIRSGAGTFNNDNSVSIGAPDILTLDEVNKLKILSRGILVFDTSGVAGAVLSASLFLKCRSKQDTIADCTMDMAIVTSTPASNTDLVNADYNIANYGTTILAPVRDYTDFTVGVYTEFVFNSDGKTAIDVGGITKLANRNYTHDILGNDCNAAGTSTNSRIYIQSADNTGTALDPYLFIVTGVEAVGNTNLLLMGVG